MTTFKDFELREGLVTALAEEGITKPTTIQEKTLPLILAGEDVIGVSNTGSGKTAAFVAPLLQNVEKQYGLQVLILAPTRELAVQIAGETEKFAKYLDVEVATIYGGVDYEPQIKAMKTANIIVATPGRLLDHMQQENVDLSTIFSFVLDEADKMVDMGFIEDIEKILEQTPQDRQILLFGATIAGEIERIKNEYMFEPKVAQAALKVDEDLLKQYYYNVKQYEKFSLLMHLLHKEDYQRVIIFCSARSTVDVVAHNLTLQRVDNVRIHGKLAQNTRLKMLDRFNKGEVKVLVASAVAARGLDIRNVTHVINYDVSQDPQEYVHRVGRTARAGEAGKAITILGPQDHDSFSLIFRNYDIEPEELPLEPFKKVPFDTGIQRDRPQRSYQRNNHSRNPRQQRPRTHK